MGQSFVTALREELTEYYRLLSVLEREVGSFNTLLHTIFICLDFKSVSLHAIDLMDIDSSNLKRNFLADKHLCLFFFAFNL